MKRNVYSQPNAIKLPAFVFLESEAKKDYLNGYGTANLYQHWVILQPQVCYMQKFMITYAWINNVERTGSRGRFLVYVRPFQEDKITVYHGKTSIE